MDHRYQDGSYLKDNPGWHAQDAEWKLRGVLHILEKARWTADIKTAADVGCGSGELLKRWAALRPDMRFAGYELSPQAFALCQKDAPCNACFMQTDGRDGNTFDAVLALDVLEHVPDYHAFLELLAEKSARAVLHVPLDLAFRTLIKPEVLAEVYDQVGHLHYFTAPFLRRVLKRHGWDIICMEYTNKYLDFPPKNMSARSKLGLCIRRAAHYLLPRAWAAWLVGGYSVMLAVRRKN